jgi:GNAT superfamily N-acetyltransferase
VDATPVPDRQRLGLQAVVDDSVSVLKSETVSHLFVNRVTGLGLHHPASASELDDALARVHVSGRPANFIVQLSDDAAPSSLEVWARARGLVPFRRDWVILARALDGLPDVAAPFLIERASDRHAPGAAAILCEAFDMPAALAPLFVGMVGAPGWHVYVATEGSRIVAAAVLFVHERVGYLAAAATGRPYRGLGIHDALIARRAQVARALGCDLLVTETGTPVPGEPSPSLDNMLSQGFARVGVRRNRVPPGATWTG